MGFLQVQGRCCQIPKPPVGAILPPPTPGLGGGSKSAMTERTSQSAKAEHIQRRTSSSPKSYTGALSGNLPSGWPTLIVFHRKSCNHAYRIPRRPLMSCVGMGAEPSEGGDGRGMRGCEESAREGRDGWLMWRKGCHGARLDALGTMTLWDTMTTSFSGRAASQPRARRARAANAITSADSRGWNGSALDPIKRRS